MCEIQGLLYGEPSDERGDKRRTLGGRKEGTEEERQMERMR